MPPDTLAALLRFETPLRMREGQATLGHLDGFLKGLGLRLAGMARWHGLDLADEMKTAAATGPLNFDDRRLYPVRWIRRSGRQGGQAIPMMGLTGDLAIDGDVAAVLPLLILGQRCHAGGGTTFGLGRYTLTLLV